MNDILPRNPYQMIGTIGPLDHIIQERHRAWQQGQDKTMKALRPMHKDLLSICRTFTRAFSPTDRALWVIDELEQILKEGEPSND